MGQCCCKTMTSSGTEAYMPARPSLQSQVSMEHTIHGVKVVHSAVVDNLIMETLTLIATFVDNEEESPVCLMKLHVIADKEDGWIQVVTSMVNVIPLENPFGPSAITILLDDCPLPSKDLVLKLTEDILGLSVERGSYAHMNIKTERNICVVLGCMAEKLAGPNSVAILTQNILEYLFAFLVTKPDPRIVLFALIALEKFAHTTENKLVIKSRIEAAPENPLLALEALHDDENYVWRQVGFCAKWALDNLFVVNGRMLSYEQVDMSSINVILNNKDVSEYLKISADGLEARCDSYSFESVRCTFQVEEGCWYYEAQVITPGVMQIGWATKNSHFLNHDGFGIGDDLYSVSYDGCRKLIWYKAKPTKVETQASWQEGDVLGCLIDIEQQEAVFYQNGKILHTCWEIFTTTKHGFFPAASFMAFQQCRFNFGHQPFKFPPTRQFYVFNDFGELTDEEKKVVPRRIYLEQLRSTAINEDACTLCCDEIGSCILEPCGHRGFCSVCTSQLKECPMCRSPILNVSREDDN